MIKYYSWNVADDQEAKFFYKVCKEKGILKVILWEVPEISCYGLNVIDFSEEGNTEITKEEFDKAYEKAILFHLNNL